MNRLLNLSIYLRYIYILVYKEKKNLQDIADLLFISTSTNFYHVSTIGTTAVVVSKLSVKKDPLEIQHPKLENSRLCFIESIHER